MQGLLVLIPRLLYRENIRVQERQEKSTDFSVANHTKKIYWSLGQRIVNVYSLGSELSDTRVRQNAIRLIEKHLGDKLEIIETDGIPDDYISMEEPT